MVKAMHKIMTTACQFFIDWCVKVVTVAFLKGQINQNFDIFSFNPIYLLCVDLVSNKHILKFEVNWTYDRRDNGT